jgi:hypothetical protein
MESRGDGLVRRSYPNGQLWCEGEYKNGKKEGIWRMWFENGQLWCEGEYKNGNSDGLWKFWCANGQLYSKGGFRNGIKEGIWKEWHPNGQLAEEGEFLANERIGVWKQWNEDGTPKPDTRRRNGNKVSPEAVPILKETIHPCIIYKEVPGPGAKYKTCTFSEEHVHDYEFLASQTTRVTKCYYCRNPLGDAVYQQP